MKHAIVLQLSEQEYLETERASQVRHEYVAGEIFAMAGGSKAHNTISLNMAVLLRNKLRDSGCQTFIADMKVRIATQARHYYPDVAVTCAPGDLASDSPRDYIESTVLLVEVLSPATEAIDRREKMLAYRHIASLREYVLIDQERRWVEVYRRNEAGWSADIFAPDDEITLESADMQISMDDLYAGSGVAWPEPQS
ncbi:hypothetical protein TPL01_24560 [Sulfuriferula plumbiphila]|uniref:Putative restriction endonuclease domain-containing protein n=1 Tax=Sulfuriferula plumbiphila TaxID=171865 RepID=A0A512LA08_9PROT|nr:Uma2 family endonuclease [Sulfuriferula plumbiphila]BBP05720.1 hypothetical protein SFPGR_31420 [Sulfuriferula plumbiphila]GEP31318.1 hypothetical protein TPL01_24560 [Sulfuriferula plumbiphila]